MHPTDPPATGQGTRPRFVRLLRLVHPLPATPPAPRKGRHRRPPIFTPEEEQLLRAALKTARGLFGSWACLAAAMYCAENNLDHVANERRRRVSADIALRLARALGVPLEALIRPGLRVVPFPKVCPTCGRGDS